MTLIDTHSHVYLPEFETDAEAMFTRAHAAGVSRILMPAIDSATHDVQLALEAARPGTCISMMGLHPCSVKEHYKEELKIARDWLGRRPFAGVGEIGLDFYWDKTFTTQQYEALHEQLEWAVHYSLPVSIHSRNATEECIAVVAEHQKGGLRGVFHCFSGNEQQARRITDLGLYLGIGGVVTFKNAGLDTVLQQVGIDRVVLETDAPYLAPVPFRGKRNEPAYLRHIAEKLAAISSLPLSEVAAITTANAEKVFGK